MPSRKSPPVLRSEPRISDARGNFERPRWCLMEKSHPGGRSTEGRRTARAALSLAIASSMRGVYKSSVSRLLLSLLRTFSTRQSSFLAVMSSRHGMLIGLSAVALLASTLGLVHGHLHSQPPGTDAPAEGIASDLPIAGRTHGAALVPTLSESCRTAYDSLTSAELGTCTALKPYISLVMGMASSLQVAEETKVRFQQDRRVLGLMLRNWVVS